MKLRSASEFVEVFQRNKVRLHVLFRGRESITGGTGGGDIKLAFTVTPNGVVSEATVLSTSFKDVTFAEAVRRLVKGFEFSPQDAATTSVASFSLVFTPREDAASRSAAN